MGPLSSDPHFRGAVRAWEIVTAPRPGMASSELEAGLQSTNRETRSSAEQEVARNFARVLLAAYRWARMNPKETDLNAALGQNLHAMIRWVSTALSLSEEPGIRFETSEREIALKADDKEGRKIKGRSLSEVMPPCWSPRWQTERHLLRSHSFAELFEAEMLNFIHAQLADVHAGVNQVLAAQKKHKEQLSLDRALDLQHRGLNERLFAFIRAASKKLTESEAESKKEARQMQSLVELTARARDSAWRLLRTQKIKQEPRTPQEQQAAVDEWLDAEDAAEGGDEEDTDSAPPAQYVLAFKPTNKKNGRFKYGR